MKKSKQALQASALFLALLMAGCSSTTGTTSSDTSQSSSAPSSQASTSQSTSTSQSEPKKKEAVTFTTVISAGATDPTDPKKAESIVAMQEKFNVTFDVEIASGDPGNYGQRLRLLATSGDLPDIIFPFGGSFMGEFAEEGFLLPLDDSVFEQIPSMKTMFDESDFDMLKDDGTWYYFPRKLQAAYNAMYMRGDWLEKLNLEIPKTIEEYEAVLRAFTYDDPDGNGVNDTYGFGERNVLSANFTGIFGAYGIIPQFWQEYEGKIYKGFAHPKIFEPLELLAKWYKDKLIDPEWVTTNTDDWWGKIATGKVGAFTAGISSINGIMARISPNNPSATVVCVPPPAGPSGKGGIHSFGTISQWYALNREIQNTDRLYEVIEYMYSEDGTIETALGKEGTDYKLLPDGGYEKTLTDAQLQERGLGWFPAGGMTLSPYGNLNIIEKLQTNFEKNAFSIYAPCGIEDVFNGFARPQHDELAQYGDIDPILLQGLFEVVCGKIPVTEYQKYIDEWYASGGEAHTKAANDDYQLMLESRK